MLGELIMNKFYHTKPNCTMVQHVRSIEGCRGLPNYSATSDGKKISLKNWYASEYSSSWTLESKDQSIRCSV